MLGTSTAFDSVLGGAACRRPLKWQPSMMQTPDQWDGAAQRNVRDEMQETLARLHTPRANPALRKLDIQLIGERSSSNSLPSACCPWHCSSR